MSAEQKTRSTPLERARRNPKSRSASLRGYYYQWVGCDDNPCSKEMRTEYTAMCRQAKRKLSATIKGTCFGCVGGEADPGPKTRVRDCEITGCALHQVRPWQSVKGRGAKSRLGAPETSAPMSEPVSADSIAG